MIHSRLRLEGHWAFRSAAAGALLAGLVGCATPQMRADTADADSGSMTGVASRSEYFRSQDATRRPFAVMDLAQVGLGDTVLQFAAGNGYYTDLLAGAVGPKGSVLAHRVDPDYELPENAKRVKDIHPEGVTVDVVWIDSAWSHLVHLGIDRSALLSTFRQRLALGGRVLLIDRSAESVAGDSEAATRHRIDEAWVIDEFSHAGFCLQRRSEMLRNGKDRSEQRLEPPADADLFVLVFVSQAMAAQRECA